MSFENIPLEIRAYDAWVVWRYEQRDGSSKPTKLPYSPRTKTLANVTNAFSWASYDEAIAAFNEGGFDGIGFVLSDNDPYAFIDLDDTKGDQAAFSKQEQIFERFDSYSELSPSGNGLHIIVKASIPKGRRREQIEVYSSARYMTMTGKVVRDAPINERQELTTTLWAQMAGSKEAVEYAARGPATKSDPAIIEQMLAARNGAKARDLYEGRWQELGYATQSEADYALIDIINFYARNHEQTARIFRSSALGQREKASREKYVNDMIEQSFDGLLTLELDPSTAIRVANALEEARKSAVEAGLPEFDDEPDDGMPTVDVGDLAGREVAPRKWHVEGWIPGGNVTLISGDGGCGKSLLALQLCVSTVLGRSWLGTRPITMGRALYLSAEDDRDELHRRMSDIAEAQGVSLADLRGLSLAPLADRDALLAVQGRTRGTLDPTPLYGALAARIATLKPSVVVIDTLADTFGGNEIERTQARQFIAMLRRLAIEYGVTVVVLSHPSQSGMSSGSGTSGSTAWSNSVRSRLYLKRHVTEADCRTLELMKSNYGATGQHIPLRWRKGAFQETGAPRTKAAHSEELDGAIDGLFLELLEEFASKGQPLSPAPQSKSRYAPKLMANHPKANGTGKIAFENAMYRLIAAHSIEEYIERENRRETKLLRRVPG